MILVTNYLGERQTLLQYCVVLCMIMLLFDLPMQNRGVRSGRKR